MLQTVIDFSVKNKLIIGLLVLALVGWGSYQLTRLPIDAVPDITDNQVQVITVSPALGAPDVERFITFPIEQACSNIPGLKEIRSFSRFGLSVVTIVFDDATNVYWARQQIAERLQQVQGHIPPGIGTPELAPVTTGLGEIYQYVVRAKPGYESRYDAMSLRTIQDWIVRRQLLGTPGVADVSTFGGLLKQYEVAVQPARLQAYGLTLADVYNALENNNQNAGGAYIEKGPNVLFIRTEGLLTSLEELGEIPLRTLAGGVALRIRDVANVRYGHATRYGAVTYNDEGEVVGAVVMMLKGENSSAVVRRVKERIEQIRKTLPEGVDIEPFLDRTKMVNSAIVTVERNLLEGALIVIFVLVFFLGNLRAGFIVASVIPLSMLFAVSLMNAFGVSGNLMSLGAIDFGLIVDGAVIVVETIMHRLAHSQQYLGVVRITREEMDSEVRTSAGRMMNAAVFGQIIILIVYLPILALEGIEGKMFRPMAQTVSFAVLGALLLSVTYVPAMSALFLSRNLRHQRTWSDRLMTALEHHHQHLLGQALRWPKAVLALAFALFAGALVVLTHLGGEFIPELEEGDFAVDTRVLTGSSLQTTIQATQQTAGVLLRHFPEVEKIVTKIGSGEIPTDPMPIEAADMMIILKNKKEWTSASSFDELAEKMAEKLQAIPGVTTGFQYPVQMRFNELMTGARQDVVCKIFGEDLDTLARYAKRLGELVQRVEGARDLYVERVTGMPQIVVRYRREALARFGLQVSEVNRIVNAAFAGGMAGLVFEGERRFDLVVRLAESERRSVEDVQSLLIATPTGAQIPLSQVADVRIEEGPNQIQREDAKRRIVVGFNVRGRDVQSIVEELHRLVEQRLPLPPGYYITYGGAFENLKEAEQRLAIAVPVALLLIFVLLYFAFGSVSQGLLIFTAIPLSAIGGVAALWLRGMPFSISAGVGFIALFGVSVLNGIVLIAEFNRLRKSGADDATDIVRQGTRTRLRPVLMTASVASLGFLPMALSTGAGAEVQRPLATVVIGGLISAGLLTLVVLPVLYVLWSRWMRRFSPPAATAALLVALWMSIGSASAQTALTLEQALEHARATHPSLQAANAGVQQAERLMGTANDLPPLEAELELGQINARFFDSRLYVRQGFYLPAVYRSRRELLQQQKRLSETEVRQVERELMRQVKAVYYALVVLEEKRRLWREWDSLYAAALERAEQRLRTGEANILEKNALETQRLLNAQQQQRLEAEWAAARRQFQQLLGFDALPAPTALLYPPPVLNDTSAGEAHPLLAAQQQRIAAAAAQQRVEQSQLLPTLSLGYTNLSITGWQQDRDRSEAYYGPTHRFSTVTLGAQVPLFAQAQRSRIAAAGLQVKREQHQLEATARTVQTEYQNALQRFRLYDEQVRQCREALEPQQRTLMNAADRQRQTGETNYLEWLLLARQTFEVRAGCLDLAQMRNEAAFEVEFWR
jgi:cobalt-zinc-cadmium resistance protein CzcA